MLIKGHHHISLYTKNIQESVYFYTHVLGLRLVAQSINQNNIRMYHIYFGDEVGHPGTVITFFDIPTMDPQVKGSNSIYRFSLLVPSVTALSFFKKRLTEYGIQYNESCYLDQPAIDFQDVDGAPVRLIVNGSYKIPSNWQGNSYSSIPMEVQILGMGPVELHLKELAPTLQFLTQTLNYQVRPQHRHILTLNKEGLYSDFVLVEDHSSTVKPGHGYTHHIAVDVANEADLAEVIRRIDRLPGNHTPIIDRGFFQSVYYRHNRIMFEFATSGPGFVVDEVSIDEMGQVLLLPDFLEARREEIESYLAPLYKEKETDH